MKESGSGGQGWGQRHPMSRSAAAASSGVVRAAPVRTATST